MEYDRTYVTQLPGRSRPSFVRKRRYTRESRDSRGSGFGLTGLARALIPPPRRRRSYSFEERVCAKSEPTPTYVALPPPPMMVPWRYDYQTVPGPAVVTKETVHTYPGHRSHSTPLLEEQVFSDAHTTKVIIRETQSTDNPVQHQCGSCGKYRSPGYQSRHPLAPGEIPKPSICRSCIRKHTLNDTSDDDVRLTRRAKRYRKKYRHRRGSHLYTTDSSSTTSTGEEDIRIIRRARSISRDRHQRRSSSASRDVPCIDITFKPSRPVKSILRRRTSDPVEIVEQTRYVERREPSLATATSRSRGSSQWYDYSEDEPVEVEYRSRGYDPSVRRVTTESYRPRRRSIVEYGYDGDYAGEHVYGPIIRHQRSESVIAQHGTPIKVEKEVVIEEPRRAVSPRDSARRRLAKSIEYESYAKAHIQPPTRAVRVISAPVDSDVLHERRGGHVSIDSRSVSVTEGVTRREHSTSRHVVEETEPAIRRRERSLQEAELESSDDYPMPGE